jgi:hypothetical protein
MFLFVEEAMHLLPQLVWLSLIEDRLLAIFLGGVTVSPHKLRQAF